MYEEGNRKLSFNWASLAIKLAILAVIVFIVCLIFTKVTNGGNSSSKTLAMGNTEYITNITAMKDAAFEYFTPSKLPEDVGGTEKLTLSQMLNQKLLIDFTEDGDVCDINSSYVQTTKTADGNYALKISLDCGEKSDFIVTTIEDNTCINGSCTNNSTNTDVVIDDTPTTPSDSNTNNNNNNNNNDNTGNTNTNTNTNSNSNSSTTTTGGSTSTSGKVTTTVKTTVNIKITCSNSCCYTNCKPSDTTDDPKPEEPDKQPEEPTEETTRWYKFVRWSDWEKGYSHNSKDENKQITTTTYDYCKDTEKTYYTTGYVTDTTKKNSTYTYELQFKDLDPDEINESTIGVVNSSKSYFSTSGTTDYRAYINNRGNLYMTGNTGKYNVSLSNAVSFKNSSLKRNNFTFDVSGIYLSGGVYRAEVTINYKNNSGVTPYYASNLGYDVYFVPLKFDVSFAYWDDCVRDSADNQDQYDGYSISNPKKEKYWVHRSLEYKWSTSKTLKGYTYTGIYEDRTN